MLAETNRHPFDLPEAEAELVSGYNVEYSAMTFAILFRRVCEHAFNEFSYIHIVFRRMVPLINIFPLNNLPGVLWFSLKMSLGVFFLFNKAVLRYSMIN